MFENKGVFWVLIENDYIPIQYFLGVFYFTKEVEKEGLWLFCISTTNDISAQESTESWLVFHYYHLINV